MEGFGCSNLPSKNDKRPLAVVSGTGYGELMKTSLPSFSKPKFKFLRVCRISAFGLMMAGGCLHAADLPTASNVQGVKDYLLGMLSKMDAATDDFAKKSAEYQALIDEKYKGDYAAALKGDRDKILSLVKAMRDDYQAADSFGYERVEGIVAGVDKLSDFDVYLDSGVPKDKASKDTPAAPTTFKLKNGTVIEGEGCTFTYLVEPTLWGKNKKHIVPVEVGGDGTHAAKDSLPEADFIAAAGADMDAKMDELVKASKGWEPTAEDCFHAVVTMTPTLSGYFDDWKDSRYNKEKSGLFTSVSRVSDMQGIMESVSLTYDAVDSSVKPKDAALSKTIKGGFADIMAFIEKVGAREKKGTVTVAEIEELHDQAQAKADKLVPQVEQAAALVGVKVSTN